MIACHNCPFICGQSGILCAAALTLLIVIMAAAAFFDTHKESAKENEVNDEH